MDTLTLDASTFASGQRLKLHGNNGFVSTLTTGDLPGLQPANARKLIQVFGRGSGSGMRVKKIDSNGKLHNRVLHLIAIPDRTTPNTSLSALALFKEDPTKMSAMGNKNFLLSSEINRITTTKTTLNSQAAKPSSFPPDNLLCFHDSEGNQLTTVCRSSTLRNEVAYFFSIMFDIPVDDGISPNPPSPKVGPGQWRTVLPPDTPSLSAASASLTFTHPPPTSGLEVGLDGLQHHDTNSVVSDITPTAGRDYANDEQIRELQLALKKQKHQIQNLKLEATRSINVAESAIRSVELTPNEDVNEKNWVESVTYRAAEAAAEAQRKQLVLGREKAALCEELSSVKTTLAHESVIRAKVELHRRDVQEQLMSERGAHQQTLEVLDEKFTELENTLFGVLGEVEGVSRDMEVLREFVGGELSAFDEYLRGMVAKIAPPKAN